MMYYEVVLYDFNCLSIYVFMTYNIDLGASDSETKPFRNQIYGN